jgi:glycosyltransferase involved in cell wall biosynthesis
MVTAVIPTRNRANLVTRAVRSALAQTYTALNVVVVVDGPDDTTEAALAEISDPRLRVLTLPSSVGGGEARNAGVEAAQGEWIAFLDDDDEWLPEKIAKQMARALGSGCNYPVVSCRVFGRTPSREYIWPRRFPRPGEPVSEYILARKSLFQGEGSVTTTTLLVKRELLLKVPFGFKQPRHQEWDWLFRAMEVPGTKLLFVEEPLCVWYIEEGRRTISTGNNWEFSYQWIERIRARVTPRAYASFLLVTVSPVAARSGDRSACWKLFRSAIQRGRPALIDLLLFCGMMAIPQGARRQLRALLSH